MIDPTNITDLTRCAPMVPEETSGPAKTSFGVGDAILHETDRAPGPASSSDSGPRPLTDKAVQVETRRKQIWDLWQAMKAQGKDRKEAATLIGCGAITIWRLEKDYARRGEKAFESDLPNCGRTSEWEPLLEVEAITAKLTSLYAATMRASHEGRTNDRRTGCASVALKAFAHEPECPELLRRKLLHGHFPACFKRYLWRVTPEVEALIRGEKHFQLHGFSGRRDKVIGLADGRRAYLPAGWVLEFDDMSVNQPFYTELPDGTVILSRQGLYARCLKGGWRAVELVARARESYTAADILRFLRRICQQYGKPRKIRIEKSVWASNIIAGFTLDAGTGDYVESEFERPAMAEEERVNLAQGLEALGIEVEFCHSARGKADLEGAFDQFQTYLATQTRDFINIGRHAGEFEHGAKQLRRVRAESHHPRDLGFPHQSQLLERILKTFEIINSLPREVGRAVPSAPGSEDNTASTFQEIWDRDTARWPLAPLVSRDYAAFLPDVRMREIAGGAVYPVVDKREFCFRALEFAELGDGFKVFVRFDHTEPSLGAAIYCRETRENARNFKGYQEGQLICMAQYEVPGCTTYAPEGATLPADLPTYTVEELYGAGAVEDGGELLGHQRGIARKFVRTAFAALGKPGQPHAKAVEQRDGHRVGKVEIGTSPVGPSPSATRPSTINHPPSRRGAFAPITDEEREARAQLFARQAEIANRLRELENQT